MIGLLNINKPAGLTSRDVVNQVQRLVRPHRAGHAGTLDPLATGVLVVCIGRATRLVPFIQEQRKTYRATFLLGRTSDTDDVDGNVVILEREPRVSREQILAALPRFIGSIEQTPPRYSAVKVQGQRAYTLARAGEHAAMAPRTVDVYRLELIAFGGAELSLEIECGSGTYVRSIGRDLGLLLGTGAVMSGLVRTRIGPFRLEDAVSPDDIGRESLPLLPAALAVADKPRCSVNNDQLRQLRQGRSVVATIPTALEPDEPLAIFGPDGALAAVGSVRQGRLQPTLVLPIDTE